MRPGLPIGTAPGACGHPRPEQDRRSARAGTRRGPRTATCHPVAESALEGLLVEDLLRVIELVGDVLELALVALLLLFLFLLLALVVDLSDFAGLAGQVAQAAVLAEQRLCVGQALLVGLRIHRSSLRKGTVSPTLRPAGASGGAKNDLFGAGPRWRGPSADRNT